MRVIHWITLTTLLCSASASASLSILPLNEAVKTADAAVIGTLTNVREWTNDGIDYGQGEIVVDDGLWLKNARDDRLLLRWSNPSNLTCPRVEHGHREGLKAIWLLQKSNGGGFSLNHPARVRKLSEKQEVVKMLRGYPLLVRRGASIENKESASVIFIYRNASDEVIEVPPIAYTESGGVVLGQGLEIEGSYAFGMSPKVLRAKVGGHTERVMKISPGNVHTTEIPLTELLRFDDPEVEPTSYRVVVNWKNKEVSMRSHLYESDYTRELRSALNTRWVWLNLFGLIVFAAMNRVVLWRDERLKDGAA